MKNKLSRLCRLTYRKMVAPIAHFNAPLYTKIITKHYKRSGMNITGAPYYLCPSIWFDGTDYSLITIENGLSISKNVTVLTHDFSANTVYKELELKNRETIEKQFEKDRLLSVKPIRIGAHTFIGMNSTILPGSNIGSNCIIGAGSVVRGIIPDNSIAYGNPAVVIKKTSEWLERKYLDE